VGRHLVLFDGVCGLCNGMVQFVLPRDRTDLFDFASLQSATGRRWLTRFNRNPDRLDTFVVIKDYKSAAPGILIKSRAALFLAGALGFPWPALRVVGVLPDVLLNPVYDVVARYRYNMFGRYDACPLPAPDQRRRFIDI
jgi:predicted DCC family thiol-disulfide oxidoreductase YuxK